MKILVIGKGGREHALAYACKRSALCDELISAIPGLPGAQINSSHKAERLHAYASA